MTILEIFDKHIRFFDGAIGTECIRHGLAQGTPPELWTLERPDIIRAIHRQYVEAGAQVITTNTFGGNRYRLRGRKLESQRAAVNRTAVELAKREAEGKALIAGSVGPLGEMLEPYGTLSSSEAREAFHEQIADLIEAGVDLILIETMMSVAEARCALEAAKDAGAKTIAVTFTFEGGADPRTPFGETPDDVITALEDCRFDIVGANCGDGFVTMNTVAERMKATTTIPVLIQSNAGLPSHVDAALTYPETKAGFADFGLSLWNHGVDFIGGCCGTTPEHIRQLREAVTHQHDSTK